MSSAPLKPGRLLFIQLVTLLKLLHAAGRIYHLTLSGEERMTLAAQFYSQLFPGRAGGKSIAARTDYFGIFIIFRMNFFFHYVCSA